MPTDLQKQIEYLVTNGVGFQDTLIDEAIRCFEDEVRGLARVLSFEIGSDFELDYMRSHLADLEIRTGKINPNKHPSTYIEKTRCQ